MNETNTETRIVIPLTGNRYNPTKPSRFAKVIPAPAYGSYRKSHFLPKSNSKRDEHRAEVAARKAGVS